MVSILAGCLTAAAIFAPVSVAAVGDVAYRCNNNDICLLDPDGAFGNSVNLTDNGSTSGEAYPFWSPDGSRLGFMSNFQTPGAENLFTMDPTAPGQSINVATQLTHYTSGTTREAIWSPDGSKVAYEHGPGSNPGVFVVNSDGSTATPVTIAAAGRSPTFSPDGTKIAYSSGEQVYIANADGSGTPQPLANGQGHSPAWSPGGTRIAFDKNEPSGPFVDLNIVNANGTGPVTVLNLDGSQFSFATWSPDGARIAFRDVHGGGYGYYRVANADGSGDHPLVKVQGQNNNDGPSWSPDGRRLAFSAFGSGVTEVHMQNADGSGSDSQLTTGGGNADGIWKRQAYVPPEQPPLPGPKVKPKLVWITKRIPWQPGAPIIATHYYCPAPVSQKCLATAKGRGKSNPRLVARGGERSERAKAPLVASGRIRLTGGKNKKLAMKVTKAGKKLLLRRGSLKLTVTLTSRISGQPAQVYKRTVRVYVKKSARR